MADALADLTEKEKDALRLIVSGHDAKSAAVTLGLSVHTINERLRHARRKLSVTSSREAARMLHESEANAPKNLGYKPMGDASPNIAVADEAISQTGRPSILWIGAIIMLSLALGAALAFSGVADGERKVGDPATAIEMAQLRTFESAARNWLALVDASDWDASFSAAGQSFQKLNAVKGWRDASKQARVPLGSVIKREVATAEYVAAPPEGYVVLRFRSQFENRESATESVTLEREGERWKVVGYVID